MSENRKLGMVGKFHRWNLLGCTGDVVGRCLAGWSRPAGSRHASQRVRVVLAPAGERDSISAPLSAFAERAGSVVSGVGLAGACDLPLLVALQKTGVAERIAEGMWQAYGKPLKVMAAIVLFVLVGLPVLGFIRKVLR